MDRQLRPAPGVQGYSSPMIRFLVRLAVYLVAVAIALIIAAVVVDGMSIDVGSFVIVVVIFAVLQSVLTPFIVKVAHRSAPAFLGAASLFSTLVALVITALVADGLQVTGLSSWVFAALIIWLTSMVATWLLPLLLVKMGLQQARARRADE